MRPAFSRSMGLFALVLFGCEGSSLTPLDPVTLTLDSPTYGAFLGAGPIFVEGHVSPAFAVVKIEGERVAVDANGKFLAAFPFEDRYRIIDVQAASGNQSAKVRVPVFDGNDPRATWPGSASLRLTQRGLEHLARGIGPAIDATGWETQIESVLPAIGFGGFAMTPVSVTHDPTLTEVVAVDGGVDLAVLLKGIEIQYDLSLDLGFFSWEDTAAFGFSEVKVGLLATPSIDNAGMLSLQMSESTVTMDEPTISVGSADLSLLDYLAEAATDWVVEPLAELVSDLVLDAVGPIPLGGPYAFGTDLLGRSLDVSLTDVYGQSTGLGAELGLALEDLPGVPATLPAPVISEPTADIGIGIHEGILDDMFRGVVADTLTQDIVLPGAFGELIGTGVRNLPGGSTVPEGEGWCLGLRPQPAQVVRLAPGLAPLGNVYLPDLFVDIGIQQSGVCVPWLQASVAVKVGLLVTDGTKVSPDIQFVEGSLETYGATTDWNEAEVVDGLLAFLDATAGLLGGMVEIDLSQLAGTAPSSGDPLSDLFGTISPSIVSSEPLMDSEAGRIDGAFGIGLQLWPDTEGG